MMSNLRSRRVVEDITSNFLPMSPLHPSSHLYRRETLPAYQRLALDCFCSTFDFQVLKHVNAAGVWYLQCQSLNERSSIL